MMLDIGLLLAVLLIVFGVLRSLAMMVDKSSPLSGVVMIAAGIGVLIWVGSESERDLTLKDVPDAVYRVIGDFF